MNDPDQARYLRRQYAKNGYDSDEQQQQENFGKDVEKALNQHGQKIVTKSIEDQIKYFGTAIEPFNMRQEESMGEVDSEGYFVLNRNKRALQDRDAWLDSIDQGTDEMIIDQAKKKIKQEGGRYQSVYEVEDKRVPKHAERNESIQEQSDEEESNSKNEDRMEEGEQGERDDDSEEEMGSRLQPLQLKQLIIELIPAGNKSANQYIKQLKKASPQNFKRHPENKELHDQIINFCNLYIEKTGETDILTKKRQILEDECAELGQNRSSDEELNWDESEQEKPNDEENQNNYVSSQAQKEGAKILNEQQGQNYTGVKEPTPQCANQDQDDIF